MALQPHILMCSPEHYGIEYEINPWMNTERQADHAEAMRQWSSLRDLLESLGAKITLAPPQPGLPDLVFTANAAMIYGDLAVLSRFRHPQRQGEEAHFDRALRALGFRVRQLGDASYFEGAGDALFCGDTLFGGYRKRSEAASLQRLAEVIERRVIPLELVDDYYYHLDTCFCPLARGQAIYFSRAFDDYGREALEAHVPSLWDVDETEARAFACNAVVVGRNVVTNVGCPRLHRLLREQGYVPHETPLGEFVKAGGSAKCLTLRLDGEEATRREPPQTVD